MGTYSAKRACAAAFAVIALAAGGAAAGAFEREAAGLADLSIRLQDAPPAAIAAPARADRYLNMNDLLALLNDRDPAVRKAALRSSAGLIMNGRVHERAIELLHKPAEPQDIRLEAARMLSYAAMHIKVQDALAYTARKAEENAELRVMAYKALWSPAGGYSRVQQFLADSVRIEKDPAVRRAVIWAMFDSTRNNKTRDLLTDLLRYRTEDEATKIEMIKSLYNGMVHQRTQDVIMAVVNDRGETNAVKVPAILALSGVQGSRPQHFLESVLRNSADAELKAAAIEALSGPGDRMREYFHLSYRVENGGVFDPIERE